MPEIRIFNSRFEAFRSGKILGPDINYDGQLFYVTSQAKLEARSRAEQQKSPSGIDVDMNELMAQIYLDLFAEGWQPEHK